jgi:hypothetical protein
MSGSVADAIRLQEEFHGRSEGAYNNILVMERNAIQLFLRELGHPDPEDEKMIARMQFINDGHPMFFADDGTMIPGNDSVVTYTPKNWEDWVHRKLSLYNLVDYIKFRVSQVDLSDPVKAKYWNEKYPWLARLREKQMEIMAERQKKLALIAIKGGPSTEEDFKFLYLLLHGRIELSAHAPHRISDVPDSERLMAARYLDTFFKNDDRTIFAVDPINRLNFANATGMAVTDQFNSLKQPKQLMGKITLGDASKVQGKTLFNEIYFDQ